MIPPDAGATYNIRMRLRASTSLRKFLKAILHVRAQCGRNDALILVRVGVQRIAFVVELGTWLRAFRTSSSPALLRWPTVRWQRTTFSRWQLRRQAPVRPSQRLSPWLKAPAVRVRKRSLRITSASPLALRRTNSGYFSRCGLQRDPPGLRLWDRPDPWLV